MIESYQDKPELRNAQDHGLVTGDKKEGIAQDTALARAVQMLREDNVWSELVRKYHRDVKETQVAQSDPTKVLAPR